MAVADEMSLSLNQDEWEALQEAVTAEQEVAARVLSQALQDEVLRRANGAMPLLEDQLPAHTADEWSDAQYLFVLAKINARISAEATRISRQQGRGDGGGGQPRSRSSGSRRRGRGGR